MARFVELTAIDRKLETRWVRACAEAAAAAASATGSLREVDFTEDDLEQPIVNERPDPDEAEAAATPVVAGPTPPPGMYYEIVVFENDMREFYKRKSTDPLRVGTRLVYQNGAARLVKESVDEVFKKFKALK